MIAKLIEAWFWLKIFLSPVLIAVLLIAILTSIVGFSWFFALLLLPGLILGILLAEHKRKKYGASNYWSKPMNTPDLEE